MTKHDSDSESTIILDSISDGVFTVDREWRITSFNRAAERITGVPREEAVGRPCYEVFRSSICEKSCALRETMQSGRPIVNRALYIVDVEGRRVPISVSTALFRDGNGAVLGGVETFRDLSLVEDLRKSLHDRYAFEDIIGRSETMRQLFDILPRVAESESTVLLQGESGTGKELFARALHNLSPRRGGPFIAVNCAALPDALLESELFGYLRGAFTDARTDKPGRFALANGGTIFLDEIGDISPAMQARLLRVLQEKTFEPLGGVESVRVDVRVVTATNRDLAALVKSGQFRDDLYYRVRVFAMRLPPLRERPEDLPLLIEHFIAHFNHLQGKDIVGLSESAMARLLAYDYPGNVRELANILEHAFALCPGGLIHIHQLPPHLAPSEAETDRQAGRQLTLRELEALHIVNTLKRHGGNRTAAARELGINPSTLHRKIRAMNLPVPETDGRTSHT